MTGSPGEPFSKGEVVGATAVLTFGLSALVMVLGAGSLGVSIFVVGFFIAVPLLAIFGDRLSVVASEDEEAVDAGASPVERLRDRYARGEIGEAEFERRLERLLETEDIESRMDLEPREDDPDRSLEVE